MNKVFVLDTHQQPLAPCHPAKARKLLRAGQAAVYRAYPFTIILLRAVAEPVAPPLRLKIDPGSKVSGLAIVNDASGEIVWAAEVAHRGEPIRTALAQRASVRGNRRSRKTRYRPPRFLNRRRRAGWLPPSVASRVANVMTWVRRLCQLCPIQALALELARFDTQALQNPEISGVEYQQGELWGYEVKQYVLEKWGRQCAYCDATQVPLEVDHIVARDRGGSHRVSNLTLACVLCNQKKSNHDIRDFLAHDPARLARLLAQAKAPLKDAAVLNSTRWALYEALVATGLPLEVGTGGRTKWNRSTRGLPKTHWLDAACVGASTPEVLWTSGTLRPLQIRATGHGSRQMCAMDKHGFPRTRAKGAKRVQGFQTGDIVKAIVPTGKKQGTYVGRVAVRASGSFNIRTAGGLVEGISYRYCRLLHRVDGYSYS
ncbi:MAG: HNH endonuclease [Ardenticatenales bacterium]|nr:HNH endonuclease [Ardenticatenales bacterium]